MKIVPYSLSVLGIINALGAGREQVLDNLLRGRAPGMVRESGWLPRGEIQVGRVSEELPAVPSHLHRFASRNNQLLLAALNQIQGDVDRAIARYGRDRVAVVIGSSTSGILEGEAALLTAAAGETIPIETMPAEAACAPYHYRQQEIGAPGLFLATHLQLENIAYTLSTACSSSAKVFASARNLLDMELCDAVIVGGADSLCKLTLNGFTALDAVSVGICNPFSANRDGITIGEGAALFLLERGAGPVQLLGIGESADAHHISAPHPQGMGAARAMRAALADAGLTASDIDYLNLHGTATPQNDAMESLAVVEVLGDVVPCSSTKPLTGHTLGAAGASEIGLCWLLATQPFGAAHLPCQLWDGERDSKLAAIALLEKDRPLVDSPRRMMSNSFAFGGSNCCVIIGSV